MMVLRTPRLLLRPFAPEDGEALWGLWNDPDLRRHLWDDQEVPRQEVREQIALSERDFQERGYGEFILQLTSRPETPIGFCGLRRIAEGEDVEILYGLLPGFWGQGLATEAARAVLHFGFTQAGLAVIFAGADPANTASLRVMERLGMKPDGARRVGPSAVPSPYYRLCREDF